MKTYTGLIKFKLASLPASQSKIHSNINQNIIYVVNKQIPAKLESMRGLRPIRSTSHTPTRVKMKLMLAVIADNQMAVCWLLIPAILIMEAL